MKKIILTALLAFNISAISAPWGGLLRVAWDYPEADLSPDVVFEIFSSPVNSVPSTNWTLVASVAGTNLTALVPASLGRSFWAARATNPTLGIESIFSNVDDAVVPRVPANLRTTKP